MSIYDAHLCQQIAGINSFIEIVYTNSLLQLIKQPFSPGQLIICSNDLFLLAKRPFFSHHHEVGQSKCFNTYHATGKSRLQV